VRSKKVHIITVTEFKTFQIFERKSLTTNVSYQNTIEKKRTENIRRRFLLISMTKMITKISNPRDVNE
jgi:hypothetical protein